MLQLCVGRDIEHLGSLESTQEVRVATITPLSCSPNFPRAQYLDIGTLTHELLSNETITKILQLLPSHEFRFTHLPADFKLSSQTH